METFSAELAICAGNSPVPGEFPTQRPATRSFDVYFDLRPNKRLSKQSWGWWFETQSRPLWRHRNELASYFSHDGVMTWKRLPHYWSFVKENPPVTGEFSSQSASNADVSCFFLEWLLIWDFVTLMRHHSNCLSTKTDVILIEATPIQVYRAGGLIT